MKILRKYLLTLALLVMHGAWAEPQSITVAVAANMKFAFEELAGVFTKQTGIRVQGVFGATGKLTAQVKSGAPFDVLVSADTEAPEMLYKEGWASSRPRVYAHGVLVLWTARDVDLSRGLAVLADPAVRRVAIPNPRLAPYGRAAMQALESAGLTAAVEPKLVYGESIGQAAQFVASGAADAGFNAKSIGMSPDRAGKTRWVEVPKDGYKPIEQSVVLLKHGAATHPDAAQQFVDFLFTPKARVILQLYGYQLP